MILMVCSGSESSDGREKLGKETSPSPFQSIL